MLESSVGNRVVKDRPGMAVGSRMSSSGIRSRPGIQSSQYCWRMSLSRDPFHSRQTFHSRQAGRRYYSCGSIRPLAQVAIALRGRPSRRCVDYPQRKEQRIAAQWRREC
jgi:hypothetical protein